MTQTSARKRVRPTERSLPDSPQIPYFTGFRTIYHQFSDSSRTGVRVRWVLRALASFVLTSIGLLAARVTPYQRGAFNAKRFVSSRLNLRLANRVREQ